MELTTLDARSMAAGADWLVMIVGGKVNRVWKEADAGSFSARDRVITGRMTYTALRVVGSAAKSRISGALGTSTC